MKTAKAVIEKSVWALVLGLGLVLAAQAQPADSTGAGRVISSQGTISSSSGTTGTLTAEDMRPAPAPAPVPQSGTNVSWTMYFKNTSKCDWASCAYIDSIGQVSWTPTYNAPTYGYWEPGTLPYQPHFPLGVGEATIGEYQTCQRNGRGFYDVVHYVKARPTVNPSTGAYLDWKLTPGAYGVACDFHSSDAS